MAIILLASIPLEFVLIKDHGTSEVTDRCRCDDPHAPALNSECGIQSSIPLTAVGWPTPQ